MSTPSTATCCDPLSPRRATVTAGRPAPGPARRPVAMPRSLLKATATAPGVLVLAVVRLVAILGHPGGRPLLARLPLLAHQAGLAILSRPKGDRHGADVRRHQHRLAVAILGHPRGQPPPLPPTAVRAPRLGSCDPRSPRKATATTPPTVRAWPSRRCHPRSPLWATAAASVGKFRFSTQTLGILAVLVGRPPLPAVYELLAESFELSSSLAQRSTSPLVGFLPAGLEDVVAILGRPAGRPPPVSPVDCPSTRTLRSSVAPGERPPPGRAWNSRASLFAVLSHHEGRPPPPRCACLDRLPRRCDPRPPEGDRHDRRGGDVPRPDEVAIHGHPGGRPPQARVDEAINCGLVVILSHTGGRPPPPHPRTLRP